MFFIIINTNSLIFVMMVISSPPRELISIFPNKSSPGFSPVAILIPFKSMVLADLTIHIEKSQSLLSSPLAKDMIFSSLPSTELLSHQKDSSWIRAQATLPLLTHWDGQLLNLKCEIFYPYVQYVYFEFIHLIQDLRLHYEAGI